MALTLSLPAAKAQEADLAAIAAAIEAAKTTEALEAATCDPFVDPGCNPPVIGGPAGCSVCAPELFVTEENRIFLPKSINVGDDTIILRRSVTAEAMSAPTLAPQIGF
ncbi:MAG: hypothetical protein AAF647_13325 [Pseudomonadota bacterium]